VTDRRTDRQTDGQDFSFIYIDVVAGNDGLIRSVKILAEQTTQSVDCTRLRYHVRRIQSRPVNMPRMINKLQATVIVVNVWIHKMSAPSGL